MNQTKEFLDWWERQDYGLPDSAKFAAWNGWLASREATAKRCVEICRERGAKPMWSATYAAKDIEREFGVGK